MPLPVKCPATLGEAVEILAKTAVVKQAFIDFSDPMVRKGLIGAGIGAGVGGLAGLVDRKRTGIIAPMALGGILGGGMGAGMGLLGQGTNRSGAFTDRNSGDAGLVSNGKPIRVEDLNYAQRARLNSKDIIDKWGPDRSFLGRSWDVMTNPGAILAATEGK